jgi:hypothetical protein
VSIPIGSFYGHPIERFAGRRGFVTASSRCCKIYGYASGWSFGCLTDPSGIILTDARAKIFCREHAKRCIISPFKQQLVIGPAV